MIVDLRSRGRCKIKVNGVVGNVFARVASRARLRTTMSSSRGGVTERSLSRVGLYDPVRVAQPVVSSFFNVRSSLCMRAPVRARASVYSPTIRATHTRASAGDSEQPTRTIGKYS